MAEVRPNKEDFPNSGSVRKNTYYVAASQGVHLFLGFFLSWAAARMLGDADFGKYNFAFAMSFLVYLLSDLGVVTYVTRETGRQRDLAARLFSNGAALKGLLLIFGALFLAGYLRLFSIAGDKLTAVLIFAVHGALYSFNQLCIAVYRGFERMEYEMRILIIEKAVITALGLFVLMRGWGLVPFALVFVIGAACSLILNLVWIRRTFIPHAIPVDWTFARRILGASIFLGLFWIITNIHERVDVLMLEAMTEDRVLGWYSLAYRLFQVASVVPMVLMTSTFPRISRDSGQNDARVRQIFRVGMKYLFIVALPMVVGTLFLSEKIVLFFGADFRPAAPALKILIMTAAVDFFSIFYAGFLLAWNRQRDLTLLQTGALILNVSVNLVLIPRLGHVGAATATLVSRGLIFAVCSVWIFRKTGGLELKSMGLSIVAASLMGLLLYLWQGPLLLTIVVSGLAYGGILYILGGIRPDEILIMRKQDPN